MRTYRGLAVSEEHRELAVSARAVLADRNALGAARAAADGASEIIRPQIAERVLGLPRG
jgi:hypothetical protein